MIIVFGSNILDLFFHRADLPPKDTAVHLETHVEQPGGKGANQAVAAARAGAEVAFYGALGEGGHGRQMYKNLAANGIDVSGVKFLDVPSGLAAIFVDDFDGTHKVVVSQGANLLAKQEIVPDKRLTGETIVLVQGELPMAETEALIARAKKKGARAVMNLAPASEISEEALYNLDIIVLNTHEADMLGRQVGIATEDKLAFAQELQSRFDLTTIVTLGPDGALCAAEGGEVIRVASLPVKPVDTIGAGDAFVGYLCAALDQGKPLAEALKYGSVAGSLTCEKIGAQTALPSREDVEKYLAGVSVSKGLKPVSGAERMSL